MELEISNLFHNFTTKSNDDFINCKLNQIEVSDKEEIKIEKAQQYFIEIINYINGNHFDFQKLHFITNMVGVFSSYYSELFPQNWIDQYKFGNHNIPLYKQIQADILYFLKCYNNDLNHSLIIIKMFILIYLNLVMFFLNIIICNLLISFINKLYTRIFKVVFLL